MLHYLAVFFVPVLSVALSAQTECHPNFEFPCDDGKCIDSLQWCDGRPDCSDASDERYCSGVNSCLDIHFPCKNGKCVPLSGVCNEYDDCGDLSDEASCYQVSNATTTDVGVFEAFSRPLRVDAAYGDISKLAMDKAVEYFLKQKDFDHGWGSFTPRAVIAMAFASRVLKVEGLELMKKQLNVQLLLDLMENQKTMTLSGLCLYINALFATCQDPSNFQGVDLLAKLRSDTDLAIESKSAIPLAFLTLCLAGQLEERDARVLADMYDMEEFQRTSSKSLIMMAMICYSNSNREVFTSYKDSFFLNDRPEVTDIYSKTLFMQASIGVGYRVPVEELAKQQLPDGSFGDMLATYYAIPVLMWSSLLDVRCNSTIDAGMEAVPLKSNGGNRVVYSLWISAGAEVNSHSLTIGFDGDKKFSDIMKMAAVRDPFYRFQYDDMNNKKIVYSIAGIPNDSETGKSWKLYIGKVSQVVVNSVENLKMQSVGGVDQIQAQNDDHFVFWFTRDL